MARQKGCAGGRDHVRQKIAPIRVSGWQKGLVRLVGSACKNCRNERQMNPAATETDRQQKRDTAKKAEVDQLVPRRFKEPPGGRGRHKQREHQYCRDGKAQCRG